MLATLAGAALFVLQGCGQGDASAIPKYKRNAPGEKTVASGGPSIQTPGSDPYPEAQGVAIVSGVVKLNGEKPPKRETVKGINADAKCHAAHKDDPLRTETEVVSANMEIANCIVFVSAGLDKYKFEPPTEPILVDQVGCQYKPHVFTIMVDQPIHIKNSDSTVHNVNSPVGNWAQSRQGEVTEKNMTEAGFLNFSCDIHPWMTAKCGSFFHPFHAVTGENGSYAFSKKLLPGKYKISVWHEKYSMVSQDVEIKAGQSEAKVEFKMDRK